MTFSENAKTYLKFSAVLKISRNDKFKDDLVDIVIVLL